MDGSQGSERQEGAIFRHQRVVSYAPQEVFEAFARPEVLARWWGPSGFTNTFEVFEFKAGGRWKFIMHGPDGSNHANESVFLKVDPPSTVVIQHVSLPHFILTVTLTAQEDGTKVNWVGEFQDSAVAARIRHIVEPANEQNLDRLESALASGRSANNGDSQMTQTEIGGVAPLFIVRNVPATLAFYRDRLGFDITFQGPEPNDIFFGIVQRGRAMIMFKEVGIDPVPNYTRDIGQGIAAWDAYIHVPDPDALAAEFASRKVEFFKPLMNTSDDLRGFEIEDADGYVLFFGRPNRNDEG